MKTCFSAAPLNSSGGGHFQSVSLLIRYLWSGGGKPSGKAKADIIDSMVHKLLSLVEKNVMVSGRLSALFF